MEEIDCKEISGAPTTLAVKELMMVIILQMRLELKYKYFK